MGGQRPRWNPTTITLVLALLAAACSGGDDDQTGGEATPTRGGVFRTAATDFSFTNAFDPTGEYSARGFNLYAPLLRTLVSFRHVGGPPGNELQPDLATELPQPTDNGLTYTFKLKPNTRFGPPLNRAITSKDIAYAFQRINTKPMAAQYGFYYFGVVKGMDGQAKTPTPRSRASRPPTTRRSSSTSSSRPGTSCTA